jgi:hypothetical protein
MACGEGTTGPERDQVSLTCTCNARSMGEPDIVVAHWAMSAHKLLDRYPRYWGFLPNPSHAQHDMSGIGQKTPDWGDCGIDARVGLCTTQSGVVELRLRVGGTFLAKHTAASARVRPGGGAKMPFACPILDQRFRSHLARPTESFPSVSISPHPHLHLHPNRHAEVDFPQLVW